MKRETTKKFEKRLKMKTKTNKNKENKEEEEESNSTHFTCHVIWQWQQPRSEVCRQRNCSLSDVQMYL